ncbi:hypothetical protein BCR25_07740 [Enterococcus termitis]|uniref:Uncharacterized protein n=1 Tax=Enterococcus termitis TaxID=332950 RepID=A0A1E5GI99_9ENTE|nr:hypothetical protein BCR25_07740 [Enterococcus termitis]
MILTKIHYIIIENHFNKEHTLKKNEKNAFYQRLFALFLVRIPQCFHVHLGFAPNERTFNGGLLPKIIKD